MTTTDPPPGSADPSPAPPDGQADSATSRLDGVVRGAVTLLGAWTALSQISDFVRTAKLLDLGLGLGAAVLCLVAVESLRRWLRRRAAGHAGGAWLVPASTWLLAVAAAVLVGGSLLLATVPAPPDGSDAAQFEFADDFSSGELLPELWNRPDRPDVISVVDGRLTFRITPELTAGTDLDARLRPQLPDGAVDEITAVATAEQGSGSPGGVAVVIRQGSGRESRLSLGPGPSGPTAEVWLCRALPCGAQYGEFEHAEEPLVDGAPTPIRIRHAGGNVELGAGGARFAASPDPTPIVDVVLTLYAGPDEQWAVTLDDFRMLVARTPT